MREFGKAVGALLVDCAVTICTTVVVDTGVKVIENAIDAWFGGSEEDETQEITAVQGGQKEDHVEGPNADECPPECPGCAGCIKYKE